MLMMCQLIKLCFIYFLVGFLVFTSLLIGKYYEQFNKLILPVYCGLIDGCVYFVNVTHVETLSDLLEFYCLQCRSSKVIKSLEKTPPLRTVTTH